MVDRDVTAISHKHKYGHLKHFNELRDSDYGINQNNDYIMGVDPNGLKLPIDIKLFGIINLLWKNNITTYGWNQPKDKYYGIICMSDIYLDKILSLFDFINPTTLDIVNRTGENGLFICVERSQEGPTIFMTFDTETLTQINTELNLETKKEGIMGYFSSFYYGMENNLLEGYNKRTLKWE